MKGATVMSIVISTVLHLYCDGVDHDPGEFPVEMKIGPSGLHSYDPFSEANKAGWRLFNPGFDEEIVLCPKCVELLRSDIATIVDEFNVKPNNEITRAALSRKILDKLNELKAAKT